MTAHPPEDAAVTPARPIVSVVMPAFNAERYVSRAVNSVLDQTIAEWELVVVNDGSTDGTENTVRRIDDHRIRVISQDNRGAGGARNTGFAHARGRYVALLDADDWYDARHLERTTGFLEIHPECSLVGTNFYFIDYRGDTTLGCRPRQIMGREGDGVIPDYFRATMRNRCFPITCCALFRRELISAYGGFDETLPSDEDHDFWTRWAMQSQFGYIDEPLCYYRIDTPNSNRKNLEESIRARTRSWRKLTAMESPTMPLWDSYAQCRSFYLFRLTALAVAMGMVTELREIASFWPASPRHLHWWLGRGLSLLPDVGVAAVHATLGRTDFVRYRQGRPAPDDADVV